MFPRRSEKDLGHKTVELEEEQGKYTNPVRNISTRGKKQESVDNVEWQAQQN